jgi:hypothetical protein
MGKWAQYIFGKESVHYDDLECYEKELDCARKSMQSVLDHH